MSYSNGNERVKKSIVAKREPYLKFIALLVILAIAGVLVTACGGGSSNTTSSNGGSKGPFTIGVSNGFVASEWRTQMIQDMQTANAEYMKLGLTKDLLIQSADVDVPGQIQQIRTLMNRGATAIIISP